MKCVMCEGRMKEGNERYVLVGDVDALRHAGSGDELMVCKRCAKEVVKFVTKGVDVGFN